MLIELFRGNNQWSEVGTTVEKHRCRVIISRTAATISLRVLAHPVMLPGKSATKKETERGRGEGEGEEKAEEERQKEWILFVERNSGIPKWNARALWLLAHLSANGELRSLVSSKRGRTVDTHPVRIPPSPCADGPSRRLYRDMHNIYTTPPKC